MSKGEEKLQAIVDKLAASKNEQVSATLTSSEASFLLAVLVRTNVVIAK